METRSSDPFLGMMIRGYCLKELLGKGSLTAVYRGYTEELWQVRELIITILLVPDTLPEQARAQFKARFMRDARRLALLRHQHLHPFYGYGEQDGIFYLLSPPVQGEPLVQYLLQWSCRSLQEALSILHPLAKAFDYLHSQGLVCQFFNPSNVVVQSDQGVLLSGFGLPQLVSSHGLTNEEAADPAACEHLKSIGGTFLGMPEYLTPEIVKGTEVDSRSDIYTLGILLFELLSGKPPFTGKNYLEIAQKHVSEPLPSLHDIAPELPLALDSVINRALHRNPDLRFQTSDDFVTACTQMLNRQLLDTLEATRQAQTIELMRAQVPLLHDDAPAREENCFLLEGHDTLFHEESAPSNKSAVSGKEVVAVTSTSLVSLSHMLEKSKRQVGVPSGPDHLHSTVQISPDQTKFTSVTQMASHLRELKERLEAQTHKNQPDK